MGRGGFFGEDPALTVGGGVFGGVVLEDGARCFFRGGTAGVEDGAVVEGVEDEAEGRMEALGDADGGKGAKGPLGGAEEVR